MPAIPEIVGTMGRITGRVHLISTPRGGRAARGRRPGQARLHHPDDAQRRRHARRHRSAEGALSDDRRPRHQGHLLRNAKPPASGAGTRKDRRCCARGRRAEQLELEPAARDRRRKRGAELSDRGCPRARPELDRRRLGGRHHRRRVGPGRARRGGDRAAARDDRGRARGAARRHRERPLPHAVAARRDVAG